MTRECQGRGIGGFKASQAANSWLLLGSNKPLNWFPNALKTRFGVWPTREFLARGRPGVSARCRWCKKGAESDAHILGECQATRLFRISRHNRVCAILAGRGVRKGWKVYRERTFKREGLPDLRPDLVFIKGRRALVADVTILYERDRKRLKQAEREKRVKYRPVKPVLKEEEDLANVYTYGFVVGARGQWYGKNNKLLYDLGYQQEIRECGKESMQGGPPGLCKYSKNLLLKTR